MRIGNIRSYNQTFTAIPKPQKAVEGVDEVMAKKLQMVRRIKEASERVAKMYADPEFQKVRAERRRFQAQVDAYIAKRLEPTWEHLHTPIDI